MMNGKIFNKAVFLGLGVALFAAACGDDDDILPGGSGGVIEAPLAIIGGYEETSFGIMHSISDMTWEQSSSFGDTSFAISQFSNEEQFVVAQNASTNGFNPDLWSRFDWAEVGGELWYCQTLFDGATQADALSAAKADAADVSSGGCGGFSWSLLSPL